MKRMLRQHNSNFTPCTHICMSLCTFLPPCLQKKKRMSHALCMKSMLTGWTRWVVNVSQGLDRDGQPFTLVLTPMKNSEQPLSLTCMSLACGRKTWVPSGSPHRHRKNMQNQTQTARWEDLHPELFYCKAIVIKSAPPFCCSMTWRALRSWTTCMLLNHHLTEIFCRHPPPQLPPPSHAPPPLLDRLVMSRLLRCCLLGFKFTSTPNLNLHERLVNFTCASILL